MLENLGVSRPAEAIYRAMLRHPRHGVADLAAATALPASQVRDALNELGDLALLKPSDSAGLGLRPVNPKVGLAALLAAAEAEAVAKQAQVETARAAIAAITAEHMPTAEDYGAMHWQGLDAVRSRLEELQLLTETECLSLNPGGAHRADARSAATPVNQQALERGVVIRAVCRDSFRNDAETLAYARWMTSKGGQMRTVPTVPVPLVVIDRRIAMLPLDPDDPRQGALEVSDPGVVATACALFEQVWSVATPFGEAAPADENGCTPLERTLLEIANTGCTDVVTARRLGVSLRTVRRMMSDLMVRLDATSRFQAGVNAAKRGWL
ncbi:LuxR family transcriptional regulator [Kitasatospora sp. NPDC058965]|uniref:LuxR family transcriptional regulator n=1 Tax=Kitasatospora sp. NPDC058965 TaxID=3346682 RepID=UPI003678DA0E